MYVSYIYRCLLSGLGIYCCPVEWAALSKNVKCETIDCHGEYIGVYMTYIYIFMVVVRVGNILFFCRVPV